MGVRTTMHNGRGSARHNDRDFDVELAEHIDGERADENFVWECYGDGDTFQNVERRFYDEHFQASLDAKNARYIEQGHPERVRDMDAYMQSRRTCPEETILQLGTRADGTDVQTLLRVSAEYLHWREQTFPNVKTLSFALHADEPNAGDHIHERHVFIGHDKDGHEYVCQEQALREMGIERPEPDKPVNRHNNAKMTYTAMCRTQFQQICMRHGLEIITEPREAGRAGLSLMEFKTRQEQEHAQQAREQAKECVQQAQERVRQAQEQYQQATQQYDKLMHGIKVMADTWERSRQEAEERIPPMKKALGGGTKIDKPIEDVQADYSALGHYEAEMARERVLRQQAQEHTFRAEKRAEDAERRTAQAEFRAENASFGHEAEIGRAKREIERLKQKLQEHGINPEPDRRIKHKIR